MHHRLAPKVHQFQHAIFMFYLDLDELDTLSGKLSLFSRNRWNFYGFRDADHEPSGSGPLKQRILNFLGDESIDLGSSGRIMLLTLPRVLGYVFNPISIYYCFNADGTPVCSIAEVGNTFLEKKLFLLKAGEAGQADGFRKMVPKYFYVSPFSDLDLSFDFDLRIPDGDLKIQIDDRDGSDKLLISTVTGRRAEMNNRNLAWFTLKYPLVTMKVIFLIHWHAAVLWLKGVPFHRKADKPAFQREVLRPHASLAAKIK